MVHPLVERLALKVREGGGGYGRGQGSNVCRGTEHRDVCENLAKCAARSLEIAGNATDEVATGSLPLGGQLARKNCYQVLLLPLSVL